jgi:preprotein translocase subunit YajC
MVGIFYFLMIRPQQKRQKQVQQMNQDLKRGDRVVTIGGIWGEIESINDDSVLLKMESGATVRMARSSIASIREEEQPKF